MKSPWTRKLYQEKKRPLQKKIEYSSWIILGLLLLPSALFASWNFSLGVLCGGLVSIFNFYGLGRGLRTALGLMKRGESGKVTVILNYFGRLLLIGVVLYLLLTRTSADVIGLVVGLSVVVLAIIFSVIMTVFDKSYLEEV